MNKILLFSLFFVAVTSQAQVKNFSIQVSANYPLIKTVEQSEPVMHVTPNTATGFIASLVNVGKIEESFSGKIGFSVSGQFDYPLSDRFFLSSGLSMGHLRFQRVVKITALTQALSYAGATPFTSAAPYGSIIFGTPVARDPDGRLTVGPGGSVPISRSDNAGATTATLVQVPFMMGAAFFNNKLEVRAGGMLSYMLWSTEMKEKFVAGAANYSIVDYKDKSKTGFNELQAGAMFQTTYLISHQLGINISAQKYFTPIYDRAGESSGNPKYNTLSLGLEYRL